MPNRIIKESIRTSDSINELSWFEEVLFYRLIVSCDDYGRFDGRTAIIKGTLFPLKDVTKTDIEKALDRLSAVGLVAHYEVEEKPYLQLIYWEKHQNVRAKKSKYPSSERGHLITHECNCNQMNTDVPVIQSNPNHNPNKKNTMCKAEALTLFERLWKAYPEKKGKGQVSESKKMELYRIGEEHMLRCIERYKTELEKDSDWRKPQNGSTFFNSGYKDYLDENYTPSLRTAKTKNNNNFPNRKYDMEDLESRLLPS